MALTTYLISQASDHLSEKHIQLWLMLFRKLPKYKEYAFIYSALVEQRITETEGTIKARMLNALMTQIDKLGVGEVSIRGDREGTYWSQTDERMALIEEGLDVLFEDIATLIATPPGTGTDVYGAGDFVVATGNRKVVVYCPTCNVVYRHVNGYRYCDCFPYDDCYQ